MNSFLEENNFRRKNVSYEAESKSVHGLSRLEIVSPVQNMADSPQT